MSLSHLLVLACLFPTPISASSTEGSTGAKDACPISFTAPHGLVLHEEDPLPPVTCHLFLGRPGWRQLQEETYSPQHTLSIQVVEASFEEAAKLAGFMLRLPPSTHQIWPTVEPTPTPPPHKHPEPAAAQHWCTGGRTGTICSTKFISGERWSGFMGECNFGVHGNGGYLGLVDCCRAVIEGPNNVNVALHAIPSCRPIEEFLATLRFDSQEPPIGTRSDDSDDSAALPSPPPTPPHS
jgi:hypothetical protein